MPSVLLLLLACNDQKVSYFNTPPTAQILSPTTDTVVAPGSSVEFFGVALDEQSEPTELGIAWISSVDGILGTNAADASGNLYLAVSMLTPGDHAISLSVTDPDEESASASINLHVEEEVIDTAAPVGTPPSILLLAPAEGSEVSSAAPVHVLAAVTDEEDAEDAISVELVDLLDGVIWTGTPTATGSVDVPFTFTPGAHTLTVNALDTSGNLSSSAVHFTVTGDARPAVSITGPADGATYLTTDVISFTGHVSDDATPADLLALSWSSSLSGALSTAPADSSGDTRLSMSLPGGTHTITLAAIDGTGQTGSDTLTLTVIDPRDVDDDGDGYTENMGDCNDASVRINPSVTDICDAEDNDCSGVVNDSYLDTYELNNTISSPFDLGEVGTGLWSTDTVRMSGLTFSAPSDEDWFHFEAGDVWFFDDVSILITAGGLSSSGTYVLELYNLSTGRIVDSDSGSGTLSVRYNGGAFDDDEDDWAVRVYPRTWPTGSCGSSYTLTISS